MGAIASQITSLTIAYSTVYSDADLRKHQSSASLAFARGIHRGPGEFPAQMANNAENVSIRWRHHEGMQFHARSCMTNEMIVITICMHAMTVRMPH